MYPLPPAVADSVTNDEVFTSNGSKELLKHGQINEQEKITGLVLLIAQTCNLKCSYCFAKAYMGSHSDNRVMSPSTARVAIEKASKALPDIRRILFFGGEPLLGFDTIKEAVQACEKYCTAHQLQTPGYAITTNGILIDREVIKFFKAHNFSVTFSLDGPKHINDKQRQFPSGKGTYDIIRERIDMLRDAGIEMRIEAVFTDNHRNAGETIESTHEFLINLGAQEIYLTPAIGGSSEELSDRSLLADLEQSYTAATEKIMDSWLTDSPVKTVYWLNVLFTLMSRKGKPRFCGAGCEAITIDCAGKVFPCYNLMSNSLYMGSVSDNEFPGEDFRRVTGLIHQTSKDSFPKCVKCWAKTLCSACYGDTFATSRSLSAPRESICVMIRSVAKGTLLKVGEFMTDEEKWKRFVENIDRSNVRFDC